MLKQTFQEYKAMLLSDPRVLRSSRTQIKKLKKAYPVIESKDLEDNSPEYREFLADVSDQMRINGTILKFISGRNPR